MGMVWLYPADRDVGANYQVARLQLTVPRLVCSSSALTSHPSGAAIISRAGASGASPDEGKTGKHVIEPSCPAT